MHLNRLIRCVLLAGLASLLAPYAGAVAAQRRPDVTPLPPARGDASARVVILLFSDFECPYCAGVEPVLEEVRRAFDKDVQVIFKHSPLPIHPRAPLAHEAAIESAQQGRFWEMHDLLFADQQHLEQSDLVARAEKLKLDMTSFVAALGDGRHQAAVARDLAEARALGVTGTPTLFVNGQRLTGVPSAPQFIAYIRSVLSGKSTTQAVSRLEPDALDLKGAPTRGPADAPVTIVEFSDFQCPFCGRATTTVDGIWKEYGPKVRWIFKHFPLDFHPDAPLAHRAALAAGEQGKFWEMHDLIFKNQSAMKRDDLLRHAKALGLDALRFEKDIDDPRFEAIVQRDVVEGMRVSVGSTPTFFINGRRVVGAQSAEAFKAVIDAELGRSTTVSFARPAAGGAVPAEILDSAMSRGPADARVTVRWFADFGSPLHRDAVALLKGVLARHPEDVRIVFNHRPLEGRDDAVLAHEATMSAAEQGKFWEVHDLLVARPGQDRQTLASNVARLGVDREWFEEGLSTGRARAALARHVAAAQQLDVRGTPTFFVNGSRIDGVVTAEAIETLVARELSVARPSK